LSLRDTAASAKARCYNLKRFSGLLANIPKQSRLLGPNGSEERPGVDGNHAGPDPTTVPPPTEKLDGRADAYYMRLRRSRGQTTDWPNFSDTIPGMRPALPLGRTARKKPLLRRPIGGRTQTAGPRCLPLWTATRLSTAPAWSWERRTAG